MANVAQSPGFGQVPNPVYSGYIGSGRDSLYPVTSSYQDKSPFTPELSIIPQAKGALDVVKELATQLTSVGAPKSNNSGKTVQESSQSVSGTSMPATTTASFDNSDQDLMRQLIEISQSNNAREQEFVQQQMDFQREQNSAAMAFNAEQAQINRDWQEMMSNTAHQREVADMLAAGINPVLSVSGGNGATVTSGATASGVTSAGSKGNVDTGITNAMASMFGALLNAQTMENVARISANSAQAVAGINAGSAMAVQNARAEQERYIYANYPNNLYQAISSGINNTSNWYDKINNAVHSVYDTISRAVGNLKK